MGSAKSLVPVAIMLLTAGGTLAVAGHAKSIMSRYESRKDTIRCMALSHYTAMRLKPKASHQEMHRVVDMMVCELDLLSLEIKFDAGRSTVRSSRDSWVPTPVSEPGEVTQLNLKAADGSPVEVSFQCATQVGAIYRDAISACLADTFDRLNLVDNQGEPLPPAPKSTATVPFPSPDADEFRPILAKQALGR